MATWRSEVGLNLQPGQRLLIIGPVANGGVSLEAAPLVRHIAASAYRAGAALVETIWGDEDAAARAVRARPARLVRPVFGLAAPGAGRARRGGARRDLGLRQRPGPAEGRSRRPRRCDADRRRRTACAPFRELHLAQPDQLGGVAAAGAGWAAKVFPDLPPEQQMRGSGKRSRACAGSIGPDPIAAWERHLALLAARRDVLNAKRYAALKYTRSGHAI